MDPSLQRIAYLDANLWLADQVAQQRACMQHSPQATRYIVSETLSTLCFGLAITEEGIALCARKSLEWFPMIPWQGARLGESMLTLQAEMPLIEGCTVFELGIPCARKVTDLIANSQLAQLQVGLFSNPEEMMASVSGLLSPVRVEVYRDSNFS